MAAGYETALEDIRAAGRTWTIRRLKDRSQFHDPDGEAAAIGVHENVWPLFGQLWPSALQLADALVRYDLSGTVLELGCGLGVVSLSLADRGVDVIASDIHPLAGEFLADNAVRNEVRPVRYRQIDWAKQYPDLPAIDAFVASEVLYEDGMAPDIVAFIDHHAAPDVRVFVGDPGRSGRRNAFTRQMESAGFRTEEWQAETGVKGRIMTYHRGFDGS